LRIIFVLLAVGGGARGVGLTAYEPLSGHARRSYQSTTTLSPEIHFTFDLRLQDTAALPDGAQRLTVGLRSGPWYGGLPAERAETWIREPGGLFTPHAVGSTEWGPTVLLPAAPELRQPDHVWHYEGLRPLPFAFGMFGWLGRNPDPVPTSGVYHVLGREELQTPAGTFAQALQVAGVERTSFAVHEGQVEDVLLRCRRWYVPGIGLACEVIEFLDYGNLGRLTTELTSFEGLTAESGGPEDKP
jgi:hypothetical protein